MKNQMTYLLSLIFVFFFSSLQAQLNLDVDGDAILRDGTPNLSLFDTAEDRIEGVFRESANNILLESLWGDLRFLTGSTGSSSTRLTIDGASGNIGVGITSPDSKLHIIDGDQASLTNHGFFMLGELSTTNLVMDNNEIQVRSSAGGVASLFLQGDGGDLVVDASTFYVDASSNEVGIGTSSPQNKLHVMGGSDLSLSSGGYIQMGNVTGSNIVMDNNEIMARSNGAVADLFLQHDGGAVSIGVPSASVEANLAVQDPGNQIQIRNTNDVANEWFIGASSPSWSIGGNKLAISPTSASTSRMMTFDRNTDIVEIQRNNGDVMLCSQEGGQVGIGISSATNFPDAEYLLAVDGRILAEEVRVELSGSWPDYVFQSDYKLRSIEELEKSIKQNGHLPGIPSAKTIEEEGILLGDIQRRMLEKIEELSLYIIQQQKEINDLKNLVEKK